MFTVWTLLESVKGKVATTLGTRMFVHAPVRAFPSHMSKVMYAPTYREEIVRTQVNL